jgi:aldehyde:ferredoxin oxidoreductase
LEGVFQKMLRIDLTRGFIGEERLPAGWYRDAIGGLGVGIQYLLEDLRSKKPLLDDPILVMTGPLTGTPLPGTSKASLISYRRDTNQLKLGSIEGKFPAHVKLAGFDGLAITGKARGPVGLHISEKNSKIIDASSMWGKDVLSLEVASLGNEFEGSVLSIGPAGENGNPWASVLSDRWVHGGLGMGQDFGAKRLKTIFVVPDSELAQYPETRGLPSSITSYLKKHFKGTDPEGIRRSCFGCVKCCGRYDPRDDLLLLEEDLGKLQALLSRGSGQGQGAGEDLHLFYRECLKLGLEPVQTAERISPLGGQTNLRKTLEAFVAQPRDDGGDCINTHSWEEAFLNLQGWYRDGIFRNTETIPEIIEKENWALIKNCLPICERWDMNPEEMVFFLNQLTGSDYSQEGLLNLGKYLMDQGMHLYRSLQYSSVDPYGIRFCPHRFPPLLEDHLGEYLRNRKWGQTGFPEKA